jgi:flagellar biosynthesis protein
MNKTKFAISLEYTGESAPKVSAKGCGFVAEQIVSIAMEHGVPIKQDAELTELLSQVDLNSEVPPVLYQAMVQVLLFAYQVSGKKPPAV